MKLLRAICRFAFGILFILSGFLKAIDPIGSALKIKEYLGAFHLGFLDFLSIPSGILLSTAEFLIGVAILKGLRIRLFSKIALGFISFFTLLTLIIFIFNPVSDCGCFGEAIHLSNKATFLKNLFLLGAALVVYLQREKFHPIATPKIEWGYLVAYGVLIIALQGYSLRNIPQIDFGVYKAGTDLIAAQQENQEREYETTFIYEKDGVQETFTINNLPDSTWTYVDAETHLVGGASEDASVDFSFIDGDGYAVGNEIVNTPGPVFFISIYNARALGQRAVEKIADLASQLQQHNLKLYILSANTVEETRALLEPYMGMEGESFEILYADYKMVISLNRSSGGLTYVNSGIIIEKWARGNYPIGSLDELLAQDPEIITAQAQINEQLFAEISLFVILFLIVIIRFFSKIMYRHTVVKGREDVDGEAAEASQGESQGESQEVK